MQQADAVEIKIGQGVKPGLGGHLPGKKVTPEISKIRNLKPVEPSVSPGRFTGMNSLNDLKKKVAHIKEITHLEEYYPTRTEKKIISSMVKKLNIDFRGLNIVEFGSGDASKSVCCSIRYPAKHLKP